MKTFRVLITEKCNANCESCFNKNIRCGKEMTVSEFRNVCEYLKSEGNITRLKIMGGEPTVHPFFKEMAEIAQHYFESINIFTNGINNEIESIILRKTDAVIYNVACLPTKIIPSRLLPDQECGKMFETQISSDCNTKMIKTKLYQIRQILNDDRMKIALTLNCVEDVFDHRSEIIHKWNIITQFIRDELRLNNYIDHNIPYCFFTGSDMEMPIIQGMCNVKCAGLITPSLKLQYCNQSQEILANVMTNNGFISFKLLENLVREYYHKKMIHNSEKICKKCEFFERKCNGGCFMHKDLISAQSVMRHTNIAFI